MRHYSAINIHQLDTKFDDTVSEYQPLLAIWAIQIVIFCGWYRKSRPTRLPDIFEEDDFSSLTGIVPSFETDDDGEVKLSSISYSKVTNAKLLKLLKTRLVELSKIDIPNDFSLFSNVEILGDIVGLSKTEKLLLVFATALTGFPEFRKVIATRNHSVSTSSLSRILSATLGLPKSEIQAALRDDGLLALTGIVETENGTRDFENKIVVTDSFAEMLLLKGTSKEDLIKHFLKSAAQPTLELSDYPHLTPEFRGFLCVMPHHPITLRIGG